MRRREFLEAGMAAGAGMVLISPREARSQAAAGSAPVNVALLGAGAQGRALMSAALLIPGIRIRAVCDIWRYSRNTARNYLSTYRQEANDYADYEEMLRKERDLQAVIVATPDFLHAEHANACLKAGLHVYCERPMAASLDAARAMVRTAQETGKLLQIGYQRRSNPRYQHAVEKLLRKAKLPGRLTHVGGQWNSRVKDDIGWPQKFAMRDADLKQYGYASMHELRNWRTLKKYTAGVFAEFAAQAVDVVNWFLGAVPKSVVAAGGLDYYKTHEGLDTVTAVLEYETAEGTVRALCEVQTTTSGAGEITFEHFMGVDGSIKISEHPKWTKIFHEPHAASWDDWVRQGHLRAVEDPAAKRPPTSSEEHVRETGTVVPYELPVVLDKPLHQPHLENFFDACRGEISTAGKAKLNAPAEEAFRTEVVVHKVNEAVEAKRMLLLTQDDFKV